jgi:hypothetical protein
VSLSLSLQSGLRSDSSRETPLAQFPVDLNYSVVMRAWPARLSPCKIEAKKMGPWWMGVHRKSARDCY